MTDSNAGKSNVVHEVDKNLFSLTVDGHRSYLTYKMLASDEVDFYSTFTDPAVRGKGIGAQLAKAALSFAKDKGFKVHASCWYVDEFIKKHPEFAK